MKRTFQVSLLLTALMLSSVGAARLLTPTAKIADQGPRVNLEAMIPASFGDWRIDPNAGASVIPSPGTQAELDKIYDQILSRSYINSRGEGIMLTITYGSSQTQELKAHRQEVCYGAQGFEINNLSHEVLEISHRPVPVTRMFAVKGPRTEPVTYWFTMGDRVVLSRLERLVVQLKYSFAGVIADGMLVRVSNLTPDAQAGYALHRAFLNDLAGALDRDAAGKLLGANVGAVQ
ncbi:MAG: exosortase-associated protein EpsI, B-type [Pseudomonadota bacterium]